LKNSARFFLEQKLQRRGGSQKRREGGVGGEFNLVWGNRGPHRGSLLTSRKKISEKDKRTTQGFWGAPHHNQRTNITDTKKTPNSCVWGGNHETEGKGRQKGGKENEKGESFTPFQKGVPWRKKRQPTSREERAGLKLIR